MENNPPQNQDTSLQSINTDIGLTKRNNNKVLFLLIFLEIATLLVTAYFGYQYYLSKKQLQYVISQTKLNTEPNPTPAISLSPQPLSNFKYSYLTTEEYKQKMTNFLIDSNKNNRDFQIDKVRNLIETAAKEYENLDEFTKYLITLCPSSFSPGKSGSYTTLEDSPKLPFIVNGPYKISCVTNLFSPHLSHFIIDIPTTDFGIPIESVHIFVMGDKSSSGDADEYSISAPDVLKRIDQLPKINGANVEAKNKELINNDTGKLDSYLTSLHAYKKTSDFLVGGIASIREEGNENLKNLRLDQYPKIDSKYKTILDQLTKIITSIESR